MNILILRDQTIRLGKMAFCGDGCCSWMEYYDEDVKKGEIYDEYDVDLSGLEEGVDFNFVDEE